MILITEEKSCSEAKKNFKPRVIHINYSLVDFNQMRNFPSASAIRFSFWGCHDI